MWIYKFQWYSTLRNRSQTNCSYFIMSYSLAMWQQFQISIHLIYSLQYILVGVLVILQVIFVHSRLACANRFVNSFSISLKFPIKEFHSKLCHHLCDDAICCGLFYGTMCMVILCSISTYSVQNISVINFVYAYNVHIVVKHSPNG